MSGETGSTPLKRDRSGSLKFIEVNARLGGSSISSSIAGVDFVEALMSMALGKRIHKPEVRGAIVVRYLDAVAFTRTPSSL